MKVIKDDNGECKQIHQGSTIAEEAVDQLQASEKLIAGQHKSHLGELLIRLTVFHINICKQSSVDVGSSMRT